MTKLIAALGTGAIAIVLALLIGIATSFRIYGTVVLGVASLILAPLVLLFGLWLKGHGLHLLSRFFLTASAVLLGGVFVGSLLPRFAPGTVRWVAAVASRADDGNSRAAVATLAPRAVPCRAPLVGQSGETLYWWHPQDDPLRCYDRPGRHPEGKGELSPVTDAIAQLVVRQSAPKPTPAPAVVAVVVPPPYAPAAPAPTPAPQPTPRPTPLPGQFGPATTVVVVR